MRTLLQKLGIKAGRRVCFVDAPAHFPDLLGPLPEGLAPLDWPTPGTDFILFFTDDAAPLDHLFPAFAQYLAPKGMLWIAWPKRTSALATDLNGNHVRAIGLRHGLVDIKVCAIDADWSALKFVRRKS